MSDDILSVTPPPADQRLAYGADPNQFGDLRLPKSKGPFPAVMNIHGGFWRARYDLGYAGHLCAALTKHGIATWNLEYRRVGDKGGGWPGTVHDIADGYRFLRQNADKFNIDVTRILVMGHSAGGHLACWLAAHEPSVQRVVSLAGVLDLHQALELHLSDDVVSEFLDGTPMQVPDHYKEADPLHLPITAKQWVVHGVDDDIVPISIGRKYVEVKRKEQVTFVELVAADHFDVVDPRTTAWQKIEHEILKALA